MFDRVAAGYISVICELGSAAGIDRRELLDAAGLDTAELDAPDAMLPSAGLYQLLRFVRGQTGDAGLGLRLAHAFDLRRQGFWGYALLSTSSFRERLEVHRRYQGLRANAEFALWIEHGQLMLELKPSNIPADILPIVLDWAFAGMCLQHRARLQRRATEMRLWLSYPEQPHHRELRALVGNSVVFDAPCNRLQLSAADLDQPLPGDPHLGKLASEQLDARLAAEQAAEPVGRESALTDRVRERLCVRLAGDASLERIARDLKRSARTLRRQLAAAGASFQQLLEEARCECARSYLARPEPAIEEVARRLGYNDVSNFRRAFRRWTGLAPSAFRAQQLLRQELAADDGSRPAKPLPFRIG